MRERPLRQLVRCSMTSVNRIPPSHILCRDDCVYSPAFTTDYSNDSTIQIIRSLRDLARAQPNASRRPCTGHSEPMILSHCLRYQVEHIREDDPYSEMRDGENRGLL